MASKRENQRAEKLALFERVRAGDLSSVERTIGEWQLSLGSKDANGVTLRAALQQVGATDLINELSGNPSQAPSPSAQQRDSELQSAPAIAGAQSAARQVNPESQAPLRFLADVGIGEPMVVGEFQTIQSAAEFLHTFPGAQLEVEGARTSSAALQKLAAQHAPEMVLDPASADDVGQWQQAALLELKLPASYAVAQDIPFMLFRQNGDDGTMSRVGEFRDLDGAVGFLAAARPAPLIDFVLHHNGTPLSAQELEQLAVKYGTEKLATRDPAPGPNRISNGDISQSFDAELAGIYAAVARRREREKPEMDQLRTSLGLRAEPLDLAGQAPQRGGQDGKSNRSPTIPERAQPNLHAPGPRMSGAEVIKSLFRAPAHPDAAAVEKMDSLYRMFRVSDTSRETRFHYKEQPARVAFSDTGSQLRTESHDERVVKAMVTLAEAKGWSTLTLSGNREFRRQVWLEASTRGLQVEGYKPQEHDMFELQERITKQQGNVINSRDPIAPASALANELLREVQRDYVPSMRSEQLSAAYDQARMPPGQRTSQPLQSLDAVIDRLAAGQQPSDYAATGPTTEQSPQSRTHAGTAQQEPTRGDAPRAGGGQTASDKPIVGQILDIGTAPYEHRSEESQSPYVTLLTDKGERTIWGVDLPRAMEVGRAEVGDRVELKMTGKGPVTVSVNLKDDQGRVIGVEPREVVRNRWEAKVTDHRDRTIFAAAVQFADKRLNNTPARAMFIRQVVEMIRAEPNRLPPVMIFDKEAARTGGPSKATKSPANRDAPKKALER